MSRSLLPLLVLPLLLTGCPELDNPYLPYPAPKFQTYVNNIQPMVRQRCAFLGCHGSVDRPLTLYAVGFLRAPAGFPGTPLLENELTDAELAWNYDGLRMRLVDASSPESSLLLSKCLDPAKGGRKHADGYVVFADTDDSDYQMLRKWIEGGL